MTKEPKFWSLTRGGGINAKMLCRRTLVIASRRYCAIKIMSIEGTSVVVLALPSGVDNTSLSCCAQLKHFVIDVSNADAPIHGNCVFKLTQRDL
jgi:hypothetical protein